LFHQPLWMIPCLEQTWWWFHVSRHWWCSSICGFDQLKQNFVVKLAIIISCIIITCLWWEFDHKKIFVAKLGEIFTYVYYYPLLNPVKLEAPFTLEVRANVQTTSSIPIGAKVEISPQGLSLH
jgi:hypothetical protein